METSKILACMKYEDFISEHIVIYFFLLKYNCEVVANPEYALTVSRRIQLLGATHFMISPSSLVS